MKKIILFAALAAGVMSAQAQVTVEGSKFSDNWSFTLKGGAVTPMHGHSYWQNARGIFGAELRKQITPTFGLGVEGEWSVNTSSWFPVKSSNAIDHQYVGVFGTLNLMNAFAGYKGSPRVFELEAVAGTGWLHSYESGCRCVISDGNTWANKVGLNFNFNLGAAKAWTLSIKPAILWNMGAAGKETSLGYSSLYNSHAAVVEMEAGLTYHFKNSNGTHSFRIAEVMDMDLLNSLRARIAQLQGDLDAANAANAAAQSEIEKLRKLLEECLNRKVAPEPSKSTFEMVKDIFGDNYYKRYIFFQQSSSTISALQMPEIYLVADLLSQKPDYKVQVNGYASPEGNLKYNEQLSLKRATAATDALKKYLKSEYNYSESAINKQVLEPKGNGIQLVAPFDGKLAEKIKSNSGNQWNRVAVFDLIFE